MLKHEIVSHVGDLPVFFTKYTESTQLIPSHWHHHIEILHIIEGAMEVVTNEATYTLLANDTFVINAGAVHLTRIHHKTSFILLQIPYELLQHAIKDLDDILFDAYYSYTQLSSDASYLKMMTSLQELLNIYQEKVIGYPFLFNSTLHQFLYELYTHHSIRQTLVPIPSNSKQWDHLKKAVNYINHHYNEPISLKDIATHLALNPEYFCRIFKKHMGFTFLEYLNQIRLTYIYDDLLQTGDTIMQIQERHGFTNYKVFNRMFKESYGYTPSEARKVNRINPNEHLAASLVGSFNA